MLGHARLSLVITNAAQAKELQTESKLVFNRYGNRYFPFAGLDVRIHPRKATPDIAARKRNAATGSQRDGKPKLRWLPACPPQA